MEYVMESFDNLTRYRIFLSVAENKSISRAAAQLYLSQPAVSVAVKKLEESLDTTLFIRRSKGVELTEKGRILRDSVRQAFALLSDTEKSLKFPDDTGSLRIASSNVLCKFFLMPYLKAFTGQFPNTELSITCTSSARACALLDECSIDLALAAKPELPGTAVFHSLGAIDYIFVCAPACRQKLHCRDEEIFKYGKIMLLDRDNISRRHINAYCARNGLSPMHLLEVNEMDLLIEFARMGIGISCVVKQFIEDDLRSGALTEIRLPDPVPPREIGFLYNRLEPWNENISRFINIIGRHPCSSPGGVSPS